MDLIGVFLVFCGVPGNHSCPSLAIATIPPSFNNFSYKSHSWAFLKKNVHVAFNYK
jgi:hypothetical protein